MNDLVKGRVGLGLLALVFGWGLVAHASGKGYQLKDLCGGLPKVDLKTPPGFCVGMVDTGNGLVMPRGIVSLNPNTLLLIDMGGWAQNTGKVYLLRRKMEGESYRFTREQLPLDKKWLDRPHSAVLGPDGKVYIGSADRVIRFRPLDLRPEKTVEEVIQGLPSDGRHPLKSMVFDSQGNLYLNIGSASDHCESQAGLSPDQHRACPESDGSDLEFRRGVVRRYRLDAQRNIDRQFTIFAEGLRNSMALAVHPRTADVYQGENARDAIDQQDPQLDDRTLPPEELNLLVEGMHYGWPYCYGHKSRSPEYPGADCTRYRSPELLWPAHAAPLSMVFYVGDLFPRWFHEKLIVAFHGYREEGHRIVAFESDPQGHPVGEPMDLVSGWEQTSTHPRGAPVSLAIAEDGSIYLTEDRNHTVLRIFYKPVH